MRAARRLASRLKPQPDTLAGKGAVLRKAQIVSYSAGRATITLGGDPTHIAGCPSIVCTAGDNVLVLQQPPMLPAVFLVLT